MRVIFATLGVALFTLCAQAQDRVLPLENPGERFLERQREEERLDALERARPRPEFVEPPAQAQDGGQCFDIGVIDVQGVTALKPALIAILRAPYLGRCLNVSLINQLLADINAAYHRRGLVTTRTYLPRQSLTQGVLRVLVVEGRIEGFTINGAPADDDWRVLSAFPNRPGELLNLTELEQGLDQMNRLASRTATLELTPGSDTGRSVVALTIKDEARWRISLGYDDFGQEATGRHRIRFGYAQDDLIGVNDAWTATVLGSFDTNAYASSLTIPWGDFTLRNDVSYSEYLTDIGEVATLYGQFFSTNTELDTMVYRDGERKTHVFGALAHSTSARVIDDIELTPQSLSTFTLGLRHTEIRDWGVMAGDAAIVFGVPFLGSDKDDEDIQRESPHAQFAKLEAGWSGVFRLASEDWGDLRAVVSGRAQWSNVGLFGGELMTIGDFGTVRGYEEAPVSGERGIYSRHELIVSPKLTTGMPVVDKIIAGSEGYVFFDGGAARLLAAEQPNYALGAGVGLRVNAYGVQSDMAFAYPLRHGEIEETPPRLHLSVGATF